MKLTPLQGYILSAALGGGAFFSFLLLLPISALLWKLLFAGLGAGIAYGAGQLVFVRLGTATRDVQFELDAVDPVRLAQVLDEGELKVRELGALADRITGVGMRREVENVRKIVAQIFDNFRNDPGDIKLARQFLNYYLDAAIRIVQRYVDLSEKDLKSPEIKKTLKKAEQTLGLIHKAFETQLHRLHEDEVMDLDSEIAVLEQTLKMEGFGE